MVDLFRSIGPKSSGKQVHLLSLSRGDAFGFEDAFYSTLRTYRAVSVSVRTIVYRVHRKIIEKVP